MADEKDPREKREQPDDELDFDAVLADLNRQAHEKELEALASLTLLRSSYDNPDTLSPQEQERKDLDARLQKIISDLVDD
ncbi:MAG: hypothetical protein E7425_00985 [Ruminococcaceae bacterium]|jgi:hypothetical protein|nr:hypothetical protein [Oscillospiraceae bacterium]